MGRNLNQLFERKNFYIIIVKGLALFGKFLDSVIVCSLGLTWLMQEDGVLV